MKFRKVTACITVLSMAANVAGFTTTSITANAEEPALSSYAAGDQAMVADDYGANLRSYSSSSSERIGVVNTGELVTLLGSYDNGYAYVQLDNGVRGWLWMDALDQFQGLDNGGSYYGSGSVAKTIWDNLLNRGLTEQGVAAIMGNMNWESELRPNNVEDSSGYADDEYTAMVDNGTYGDENFIYDGFGYGLYQLTWWTRKENYLNFVKERGVSIANLETQLDFLWYELQEYPELIELLRTSTNAYECTSRFMSEFENPGFVNLENRYVSALAYYDEFARGVKVEVPSDTNTSKPESSMGFKVGDEILSTAAFQYYSAYSTDKLFCNTPCRAVITDIYPDGTHKIHAVSLESDKYLYGWIDEADVVLYQEAETPSSTEPPTEAPTEIPTDAPTEYPGTSSEGDTPAQPEIKAGSEVLCCGNVYENSADTEPAFTASSFEAVVTEIANGKAHVCNNVVYCWIELDDIRLK